MREQSRSKSGRYHAGSGSSVSNLEKRDTPPEGCPDYVAADRDVSFLVSQRVSRILDVAWK